MLVTIMVAPLDSETVVIEDFFLIKIVLQNTNIKKIYLYFLIYMFFFSDNIFVKYKALKAYAGVRRRL